MYFNSSPVRTKARFCSDPVQLGNVALSILKVRVLSLMEAVPKCAMLPPTMALFSSGVAVARLLDATLGKVGADDR